MKTQKELFSHTFSSPTRFTPSPIRQVGSEKRRLLYEADLFDGESEVYCTSASKYSSKRSLYEIRFKSLEDTIRKIAHKLGNDDLLDTMKQDSSSQDFACLRIKEIIDDCLHDEREMLIESLTKRLNSVIREMQVSDELYAQSSADYKRVIQELELRLGDMEEELKRERGQREWAEQQLNTQQSKTFDLSKSFEQKLRRKDEQIVLKAGQDIVEIGSLKAKVGEIEDLLSDRDSRIRDLSEKNEKFMEEIDIERKKYHDMVSNMDVLKNEIMELREKNVQSVLIISENESENREMKKQLRSQQKENEALRSELEIAGRINNTKSGEFESKLKQYQSHLKFEQLNFQEVEEKNKAKYKEKIEQFKRKLVEYKEKFLDKEKEGLGIRQQMEEQRLLHERDLIEMEHKISEQRTSDQMKLAEMEYSFKKTLENESQLHEKEIEELRRHYQRIIDTKISDSQFKTMEKLKMSQGLEEKLQASYEAKLREIIELKENEWNLSVSEQGQEIEILTRELNTLRAKTKQDTEIFSKSMEQMTMDHSTRLKCLKEEYDKLCSELQEKHFRAESKLRADEEVLEALKSEKKQNIEKLALLNEELETMNQIYHELTLNQDRLTGELSNMKSTVHSHETENYRLRLECAGLESELSELSNQLSKSAKSFQAQEFSDRERIVELEREIEAYQNERNMIVNSYEEKVVLTREEIRILREENKLLNERLAERGRVELERIEKEGAINSEIKLKYEKQVAALTSEAANFRNEANSVKSLFAEQEKTIQETKELLAEERKQRGILLNMHKSDQSRIRLLISNFRKLQAYTKVSFDNLRAERENLKKSFEKELSSAISDCRGTITFLAKALRESMVERLRSKVKLNEERQKELISSSVEKMKYDFRLAERDLCDKYESALEGKEVRLSEMKSEISRLEQEIRRLVKENSRLILKNKNRKQKLGEAMAKISEIAVEREESIKLLKTKYEASSSQKENNLKMNLKAKSREKSEWERRLRHELNIMKEEVFQLREKNRRFVEEFESRLEIYKTRGELLSEYKISKIN